MKYFKICIFRLSLKSAGSESTAIYSGEHAHNPTIPTFPVRRGSRPKRQLLNILSGGLCILINVYFMVKLVIDLPAAQQFF